MPRSPHAGAVDTWRVSSVNSRVRDGPQRVTQVYRLLLAESGGAPRAAATADDDPTTGGSCPTPQKECADVPIPPSLGSPAARPPT